MLGVRSVSPAASGLPKLPRIRTTLPAASSNVPRAKAQGNTKSKAEEERWKSGKVESASSATRSRSSPPLAVPELDKMRCSWITANSVRPYQFSQGYGLSIFTSMGLHCSTHITSDDTIVSSEPLYVASHDEEWGVPVHDDRKLFELLTLSQAIAELSWPIILSKREEFSAMIDGLYNAYVWEFTDKKMNRLSKSNGSTLFSEQKMRAAVTNAKQIPQLVQEFGSFSNYCWSFVSHRPITNGSRYARQVPSKTPKSEAMSKDLMRRGFRCVGPTTIYSFMQVAGIVNYHLPCCFRFDQACSQAKADEKDLRAERRLSSRSSEDSEISEV